MTIAYFQKASTHQPAESRWDCRFWKAPEVWWSHCSGLTFGNTSWIKDLEDHPIHLFGHICYITVVLLLYYITYTVILTYIHILIYIHVYVHTYIYIYCIMYNPLYPIVSQYVPSYDITWYLFLGWLHGVHLIIQSRKSTVFGPWDLDEDRLGEECAEEGS